MGIPGLSARQPLYYGDSDALLPEWHRGSYYRMKKKKCCPFKESYCVWAPRSCILHGHPGLFGMIVSDIPEWRAELWMRSPQSVAIDEESRDIWSYIVPWRWGDSDEILRQCGVSLCACRFRVCPRTRARRQCPWCTWWRTRTCSSTAPSPAASSTSWRQSSWDISSSTHLWSSPSVSQTSKKYIYVFFPFRKYTSNFVMSTDHKNRIECVKAH